MKLIMQVIVIVVCVIGFSTRAETTSSNLIDTALLTMKDAWAFSDNRTRAIQELGERSDRDTCLAMLDIIEQDNNRSIRSCAFWHLKQITKAHSEFQDVLSRAVASASGDQDGLMRTMACEEFASDTSGSNTTAILQMVWQEFQRAPQYRGKYNYPAEHGQWATETIIEICMDYLIKTGNANIEVLRTFFKQAGPGDLSYFFAHIFYKLGVKSDVDLLIRAAEETSSPRVKTAIINDLAEIGDARALPALNSALKDESFVVAKGAKRIYPIRVAAKHAIDAIKKCQRQSL